MKSNRQKRAELEARRARKREAAAEVLRNDEAMRRRRDLEARLANGELIVERDRLVSYNSYGDPDFVQRGTYRPEPFVCRDCGAEEVWTPHQQKWWYEVAKGDVFTTATRCRGCRARERARKAAARRTHLEGLERKIAKT